MNIKREEGCCEDCWNDDFPSTYGKCVKPNCFCHTSPTEGWREKLMDEFCVMFERATQNDDTIDWPTKLENFISQTLSLQEKEMIEKIQELRMGGEVPKEENERGRFISKKYGWNSAIDTITTMISNKSKQ